VKRHHTVPNHDYRYDASVGYYMPHGDRRRPSFTWTTVVSFDSGKTWHITEHVRCADGRTRQFAWCHYSVLTDGSQSATMPRKEDQCP
jgi:hypothetical protein